MSNTNFIIDKSTWKPVKFGDVVLEPKEVCKDIFSEGIEHVVGLEHIETGDIHLRKSETTEESTTFSKKFQKGDLLFGRRRAYLKKAAQANFDGICSGDITVFRSKEELLPDLLPFIVNNDKYFDYAVKHSAGGLSPRVKFKDLAKYKFLLPPKAEQTRLAELLWNMDEVIESEKKLIITLKKHMRSYFISNYKKWKLNKRVRLGDVTNAKQWKTISKNELTEDGYLVYGGNGIIGKYTEYNHEKSTIAIACRGEYCGNVHYTLPKSYVTGNSMCLDNLDELKFKSKFLFYYLKFTDLTPVISGSAQPQIIKQDLENYKINEISLKTQDEVILKMDLIYNTIEKINSKIYASLSLQKSIINQIF